ncbi:Csu type fimbrial protein [Neisseria wadsworthii]|uniref:Csu type fimbrial protein n=1 Tax=Neisseria wadsworthii TaxID=607711 RepID=UPI000D318648|nr:spore coat U domain-containing protein [Neisseria wadsworthii]
MYELDKIAKKPQRVRKSSRLFAAALSATLLGLLPAQEAWAKCTATMEPVNFGNVDWLDGRSWTTQAQVTVTCEKTAAQWSPQKFNVCLTADGGRVTPRALDPRRMCRNDSCASGILTYNLYGDPNHTTILAATNQRVGKSINKVIEVPSIFRPQSITFPIYAKLNPAQTNVAPGRYAASFAGGSTAMTFYETSEDTPKACPESSFGNLRFPFDVSATVIQNCRVDTPQDIHIGTVGPTAANLQGQTSINVTCTSNTSYNIGLMPSNGHSGGAGEMRAVQTGNTDRIPYQLRSAAGMNGALWGDTATSRDIGNGVSGRGNGSAQTYHVYATVDSADYRAGEYRDKVIINVHY